MKFLSNTKKTRFKLAVGLLVFIGGITVYSIYADMNDVAGTGIAGMLTIGTGYILGDSYRKSDKK
jgi:hypothetical protein